MESQNTPRIVNINDIHQEIANLFKRYNYPFLTLEFEMAHLKAWARTQAIRLDININHFVDTISNLFWAIAHAQSELGYSLIARQAVTNPKGETLTTYDINTSLDFKIPDLYFWHHNYLLTECLYRCWERLTYLLQIVFLSNINEKDTYLNNLIDELAKNSIHRANPKMNALKKLINYRQDVAKERNDLSHENSSPMKEISVEVKPLFGLKLTGSPKYTVSYKYSSVIKIIEKQKSRYIKIGEALKTIMDFTENTNPIKL
ncbi:MAG: hypothetical protein WC624_02790 [Candidatus Margulisiibacteriota bacterium]